jgi:tape measure domain-containing protein
VKLTAVISLKDNYSQIMRGAAKTTSAFGQDVDKVKRQLKALEDNMRKEKQLRFDTRKAAGELTRFERMKNSIRDKAVKITAHTEQFFSEHRHIAAAVNKLTHMPAVITIKARDLATGTISSIAKAGTGLAVGGAAVGGYVAGKMLSKSMQLSSDAEQAQIGFETMLGSKDKAAALISSMTDFANKTPFEMTDVRDSAKRMLAFGFKAEDIIPDLTGIGNAASGLGLGKEGIERITLALGQMKAKSKVSGDEMLQLTEAGIPAWDILAQKMGITTQQVMKLSEKGLIPADKAIKALIEGMNKRFPDMMEKQSHTMQGLWSTMKDTFDNKLLVKFGDGIGTALKPKFEQIVKWIDQNGDKIDQWGRKIGTAAQRASEWIIDKFQEAANWVNAKFLANPNFTNLPTFMDKVKAVWNEVKASFDGWWVKDGKQMLTDFIANASAHLSSVAPDIGKGAFDVGSKIVEGIWEGLQAQIEQHPVLTALLTTGTGAAAGASVGGPWGALIGGIAGLVGGVAADVNASTDYDRHNKDLANFLDDLHSRNPNEPLIKGQTTLSAPKKAIGMDRVPYDNYPALLHQGERVLTAQEARQQDSKGNLTFNLSVTKGQEQDAATIMTLIRQALEPVGYNVAPGGTP